MHNNNYLEWDHKNKSAVCYNWYQDQKWITPVIVKKRRKKRKENPEFGSLYSYIEMNKSI
jgi:hypothetical protein